MLVIKDFDQTQPIRQPLHSATPIVATVGFFDGVHLGHRYLLKQVRDEARRRGGWAMAITFSVHPRRVLDVSYRPQMLTTTEEKLGFIAESGMDCCTILDFTPALAKLPAKDFMQYFLRDKLGVSVLLMGYDHHFGSDRLVGLAPYKALGASLDIEVLKAEAYKNDDLTLSSSLIRRCLEAGNIACVNSSLGRRYDLKGHVVEGHHIGRDLGFPTANLEPDDPQKCLPGRGVYAVFAELRGKTYPAMLNIGFRPTLNDGNKVTIETHLFGFEGNAYGEALTLRFVRRLRDEQRFDSLEALRHQLQQDADNTLHILNDYANQ